ncbi:hypothetical protein [Citricoccus muralis]|uniref:Uncharacterized protein n=1 Tax=Citricoccus muralis TaxID=169134 RepID=A0ABY8HAD8_9MICC|nr:hypothetical protein [Citricoccus muralis]WFP17592.1 hypothetical protein P8192_05680 [Citricoccus muralis]
MTAHDASHMVRLAGTLMLGALLLTGCREGAPGTEETPEPTASTTATSAEETPSATDPEDLTEEHLAQALLDLLGEDTEILTGEAVLAQQVLRQQWSDVESAEPAECLATLVGSGSHEDGADTAEPSEEETPGPLEEAGATLAAAGTTVDASQPGSYIIEQLTVMTFDSPEAASEYVLNQRDVAIRCDTVDVTLGNGTQLRADTEVTELSHHTDEALELLNSIVPAESEDDEEEQGSAQLPSMDISTVLVRDGDQVYSYLSSEPSDVGVGLTFIDQLSESLRLEES